MNRRHFLQSSAVGISALSATAVSTPVAANRDLVTHTVAHALREIPPLLVYSGLQTTPIENPVLIDRGGGSPEMSLWNDWKDDDLASVYAAFRLGSEGTTLGTIRIFDTADIAWHVHQPLVMGPGADFLEVGGMRAAKVHGGDSVFASLRLWNVVIDAVAPTTQRISPWGWSSILDSPSARSILRIGNRTLRSGPTQILVCVVLLVRSQLH